MCIFDVVESPPVNEVEVFAKILATEEEKMNRGKKYKRTFWALTLKFLSKELNTVRVGKDQDE
ncbi:MAG: hypothetical protein ACTSPB_20705 [Candidatus Thorarchaeota archaeon]